VTSSSEHPYIVAPLRSLAVPLEELNEDPENARIHRKDNMEAVKRSLQEFGQRVPVLVQKDGMIVRAGNARLRAAKELGWTHLAAVVVEEPEALAKAYGLMDNKSAELAEWDFESVAEILRSMEEGGIDLASSGFSERDVQNLLSGSWTPEVHATPQMGAAAVGVVEQKAHHLSLTPAQYLVLMEAAEKYRMANGLAQIGLSQALTSIGEIYLGK
jgi:hypothetical protein